MNFCDTSKILQFCANFCDRGKSGALATILDVCIGRRELTTPIVFAAHLININEWAGLNVKFLIQGVCKLEASLRLVQNGYMCSWGRSFLGLIILSFAALQ